MNPEVHAVPLLLLLLLIKRQYMHVILNVVDMPICYRAQKNVPALAGLMSSTFVQLRYIHDCRCECCHRQWGHD
jgi:hypothetical protein